MILIFLWMFAFVIFRSVHGFVVPGKGCIGVISYCQSLGRIKASGGWRENGVGFPTVVLVFNVLKIQFGICSVVCFWMQSFVDHICYFIFFDFASRIK